MTLYKNTNFNHIKTVIGKRKYQIAYVVCLVFTDQIGLGRYIYENYRDSLKVKLKGTLNGKTQPDNVENYKIGSNVD